jgi:hypothetical protein
MAVSGQTNGGQNIDGSSNHVTNDDNNRTDRNEAESTDKNDKNKTNNNKSNKKNNNGVNGKTRVNIMTAGEMSTYTFTISWRPEHKVGQDGKIIVRILMREMVHRTPQIIFHPTNSASSPGEPTIG